MPSFHHLIGRRTAAKVTYDDARLLMRYDAIRRYVILPRKRAAIISRIICFA